MSPIRLRKIREKIMTQKPNTILRKKKTSEINTIMSSGAGTRKNKSIMAKIHNISKNQKFPDLKAFCKNSMRGSWRFSSFRHNQVWRE